MGPRAAHRAPPGHHGCLWEGHLDGLSRRPAAHTTNALAPSLQCSSRGTASCISGATFPLVPTPGACSGKRLSSMSPSSRLGSHELAGLHPRRHPAPQGRCSQKWQQVSFYEHSIQFPKESERTHVWVERQSQLLYLDVSANSPKQVWENKPGDIIHLYPLRGRVSSWPILLSHADFPGEKTQLSLAL